MATYTGNGGNNTYTGTADADDIYGNGGNDTLSGAGGNDYIDGGTGNDTLSGGEGADTLLGGTGTNTLNGDAGNDFIYVDGIDDTVNGGDDDDSVYFAFQTGSAVLGGIVQGGLGTDSIFFYSGTTFDASSGSASFSGFESVGGNIAGTTGNDVLNLSGLTSAALSTSTLTISAGGGNDTVTGGAEQDSIFGESGDDTLNGGAGNDTLDGGSGVNALNGGTGDDAIFADGTDDAVSGGNGDDVVYFAYQTGSAVLGGAVQGGADTDTLLFYSGATFDASSGSANFSGFEMVAGTITGTTGSDVLDLSGLSDAALSTSTLTISGGGGNDTVTGGAEQDSIFGESGDDTLNGGDGNDTLDGGSGVNALNGGTGDDAIFADGTDDAVSGGGGDDIVYFAYQTGSAILGGTVQGGLDTDTLLFYSGATFDASSGSASFGGFEVVAGTITGTTGSDVLDLSGLSDAALSTSTLTISGGGGNDTVTGGAEQDSMFGEGGDDTLNGGAGFDTLYGGTGVNMLSGGLGNDAIYTDGTDDAVSGGDGDDAVYFAYQTGSAVLGGVVTGGGDTDFLGFYGATFDETSGSASFSDFESVSGNIVGTIGNDVLDLSGLTSALLSTSSLTISGGGGNDTVTGGVENDTIYGEVGNDTLNGGVGTDTLYGGSGVNTLNGGAGNDYLYADGTDDSANGGDGDDFVYFAYQMTNVTIGGVVQGGADTDFLGFNNARFDATSGSASFSGFESVSGSIVGTTSDDVLDLSGLTGTAGSFLSISGGNGNDTVTGGAEDDSISGNNDNDTLNGGAGDDALYGNAGNDTLDGGLGADYFGGDIGIDTVTYVTAAAAVSVNLATGAVGGQAVGDTFDAIENLTGSAFNDVLVGTTAANVIEGGLGDDTVNGGAGLDTASYADATVGVTVSLLLAGAQNTGGAGSDTLISIENLTGSAFADALTGNAAANVLRGGAGDDTLDGGAGNDLIDGCAGSDTARYAGASAGVTVNLAIAAAQNTGGAGTDTLVEIEHLIGSAFADQLTGNSFANSLFGGAGVDTLTGGGGDDTYVVDDSADAVVELVDQGIDTVTATALAYTLSVNVENLTFAGTGGFVGVGNGLANTIIGGTGNDTLDGGTGIDAMIGGTGDDTYFVDDSADAITELAGEGTDSVIATALAYTLAANVETLLFAGIGDFTGTGNALANSITGGAGADVLDGAEGADVIRGGGGIDAILGGAGDDAFLIDGVADFGAGESYDGGDGTDTLLLNYNADSDISGLLLSDVEAVEQTYFSHDTRLTAAQLDALARVSGTSFTLTTGGTVALAGASLNVETFVLADIATSFDLTGSTQSYGITVTGGAAADTITGDDAADILLGGGGNDVLTGGAENDTLDGGTGSDRLTGGTGDDLYRIDATGDRVTEAAGEGYDTVESTLAYRLGLNVEALTLTGAAAISGIGNTLGNTLTGNDAANVLSGLDGADTLIGGGGNDSLNGGLGADTLVGGAGDDVYTIDNAGDTVTEAAGEGYDSVTAGVDHTLGANFERLVLTGAARIGTGNALDNSILGGGGGDTLGGGDGADTIQAGSGNDLIAGDAGNDILDGGAGRDLMTGGTGADRFVFRPGDTGTTLSTADVITDFSHAQGDRVSVALIDAIAGTPADDRFAFIGTNAFGGVAGQLRYEVSGNFTYIHGDTNGDAVSDLVIRLNGAMPLVAADFQL